MIAPPEESRRHQPEDQSQSFMVQGISGILRSGWDFAALFILAGILFLLMIMDNGALPGFFALLRLVTGLVFVLFAPGYALQAALFPRSADQTIAGRLALATGLSVAIIPPLALVLDRLPWGLHPWPVVLSLIFVTLLFSLSALVRRITVPQGERFNPTWKIQWKGLVNAQNLNTSRLVFFLVILLGFGLISAMAIIILPKPGEHFTEFYILGPDGKAENYPREGVAGQALAVTVGIHNLEGTAAGYRVEVRDGQGVIGESGPILLEDGGASESMLSFTPGETGEDVEVTFLLFRDQLAEPYRTLRLFIAVKPSP